MDKIPYRFHLFTGDGIEIYHGPVNEFTADKFEKCKYVCKVVGDNASEGLGELMVAGMNAKTQPYTVQVEKQGRQFYVIADFINLGVWEAMYLDAEGIWSKHLHLFNKEQDAYTALGAATIAQPLGYETYEL